MSFFEIGPNDSLYYEYEPPSGNQPLTFVFINAITGDTGMWQAEIGPTCGMQVTERWLSISGDRQKARHQRVWPSMRL